MGRCSKKFHIGSTDLLRISQLVRITKKPFNNPLFKILVGKWSRYILLKELFNNSDILSPPWFAVKKA